MLQGQKDETSGITVKSGSLSAYGDVIETQQRDFFHINNAWWSVTTIWRWLRFLSKTVRYQH